MGWANWSEIGKLFLQRCQSELADSYQKPITASGISSRGPYRKLVFWDACCGYCRQNFDRFVKSTGGEFFWFQDISNGEQKKNGVAWVKGEWHCDFGGCYLYTRSCIRWIKSKSDRSIRTVVYWASPIAVRHVEHRSVTFRFSSDRDVRGNPIVSRCVRSVIQNFIR